MSICEGFDSLTAGRGKIPNLLVQGSIPCPAARHHHPINSFESKTVYRNTSAVLYHLLQQKRLSACPC